MRIRKITAGLLGGVMAASILAGCGGINKDEVVATFNDQEITLGVANFAARLQQATYDDFYTMYFGEKVWSTDMYGQGTTMEESLKSNIIEGIKAMYTLNAHADEYNIALTDEEKAAITKAAETFIADNSKEALDAMGATKEIVEEYLSLATIQTHMYDAIIAEADTEVSDEEANTSSYSYVTVSKTSTTDADGNTVTYTEDDLKLLATQVEAFDEDAKENGLEVAEKPDSQDFYDGDYNELLGVKEKEGNIVDLDGKILGIHKGIWNYTIGQRKGIGVSSTEPLYVLKLKKDTNEVVIGPKDKTFKKSLIADNLNWIAIDSLTETRRATAKIRSTQQPTDVTLNPLKDGRVEVVFDEFQKSIAIGQSAVFYDNDTVLGGGVIESVND